MVGRQLPFFSLLVPFWLIWAFAGWRGMKEIWPAILVAGVSFAIPQFLISNLSRSVAGGRRRGDHLHGLPGAVPGVWKPKTIWTHHRAQGHEPTAARLTPAAADVEPPSTIAPW